MSEGGAWSFLPVAGAALAIAPGDVGVRFLFARALADVGLRTLALEQLERLPERARALPEARALAERIGAMPDDREAAAARTDRARVGAEALSARGVDLAEVLSDWDDAHRKTERFTSNDGNVVWRIAGRRDPSDWIGLADWRGEATKIARNLADAMETQNAGPITVEGLCPPWMLAELVRALPRNRYGYLPSFALVQRDLSELLDGLSMLDEASIRELLSQDRVRLFVGEHAGRDYDAWARARFELESLGPVVRSPRIRAAVSPSITRIADEVRADQRSELARLRVRVESALAGRDARSWRDRYTRATAPGSPEPLRVLLPTCRFTTFVQHAADDLRRAFERCGCRTSLLIEPDDSSRLSTIAYNREIARFDPDLIVLINYPRRGTRGGAYPDNIPLVCWVQDQMPHLLDERIGRDQGPLDFLCGHIYPGFFERFGYPVERAMGAPVVINPEKFNDAPAEGRERHACEIAYVSHHSETPEAMRDRLKREVGDDQVAHAVDWVYHRLNELGGELHSRLVLREIEAELAERVTRAMGRAPDPAIITRLKAQCLDTLGERVIRHQTLGWAASIADRRGWRLRVYGRGWEDGPFARFASGELDHNESLRACYQGATVHLHASPSTVVHQRVMECAASGGLTLCRLTRQMLDSQAMAGVVLGELGAGRVPVADDAGLMDWCAQSQRLGLGSPAEFVADADAYQRQRALAPTGKLAWTARWLLGDFSQTCFVDEASLERLVERAIDRPAWRANLSGGIRRRVLDRATTDVLARSIISKIRDSLATSAERGGTRAA